MSTPLTRGLVPTVEALTEFQCWSVFLPRVVSSDVEKNTVYVKSRLQGNPGFFDQTRENLSSAIRDLGVLRATALPPDTDDARLSLELVLHSQRIALGLVGSRQCHKAVAIGELCVELVDAMAAQSRQDHGGRLLFWRVLCRANLGDAYARVRNFDEAKLLLRQGLALAEEAGERASAREFVLVGACYAHLSRVHLELEASGGATEETVKFADLEIENFERFIWEASDLKEDKETQGMVLASAYLGRGMCDARAGKHDGALEWFGRARECVEAHVPIGIDQDHMLAEIAEHVSGIDKDRLLAEIRGQSG